MRRIGRLTVAALTIGALTGCYSTVTITSTPSGADVRIDGTRKGTTPLRTRATMRYGRRNVVELRHPRCLPLRTALLETTGPRDLFKKLIPRQHFALAPRAADGPPSPTPRPAATAAKGMADAVPSVLATASTKKRLAADPQPALAPGIDRGRWSRSPSPSRRKRRPWHRDWGKVVAGREPCVSLTAGAQVFEMADSMRPGPVAGLEVRVGTHAVLFNTWEDGTETDDAWNLHGRTVAYRNYFGGNLKNDELFFEAGTWVLDREHIGWGVDEPSPATFVFLGFGLRHVWHSTPTAIVYSEFGFRAGNGEAVEWQGSTPEEDVTIGATQTATNVTLLGVMF